MGTDINQAKENIMKVKTKVRAGDRCGGVYAAK
jgi:hypothetical protein